MIKKTFLVIVIFEILCHYGNLPPDPKPEFVTASGLIGPRSRKPLFEFKRYS